MLERKDILTGIGQEVTEKIYEHEAMIFHCTYEHKQHAFDCFCKKVLKYEAYNGYREISRKQAREVTFSELPEESMEQLASYDYYP